jgi:hypothetical protein
MKEDSRNWRMKNWSAARPANITVQDFPGVCGKLLFSWWPLNRKPSNFAIRRDVAWDLPCPTPIQRKLAAVLFP